TELTATTTTLASPDPTLGPRDVPPDPPLPPPSISSDARVVVSPRGIVTTVLKPEGSGWQVRTPCGNTASLASGKGIVNTAIVLDPGHGGDEPGATSPDKSLSEAKLNLAVAKEAAASLEMQGYSVLLTRTSDYRITLESRAAVVNALKPKAFVSIHHNADADSPRDTPGTETYYQNASADSKRLAGLVYEEVYRTLSIYHPGWIGDRDAGVKYRLNSSGDDYYGILRRTKGVPSTLAELAFISNQNEADLLRTPEVQRVEGDAVARGSIRYLTTSDPGSGFVQGYARSSPAGPGGGGQGCVDPRL
ncbi:MAG TPA: N-acetylmuramoyl-L-alanine amidase, partial [Acidimicrobiales bacterium]|nr:N-acetylmuramoyl-L-alanine amidase [Acidimicrobiales bacterium]